MAGGAWVLKTKGFSCTYYERLENHPRTDSVSRLASDRRWMHGDLNEDGGTRCVRSKGRRGGKGVLRS